MNRFILSVFVLLTSMLLTGCFQTDIAIKVNPDGSGTLEQTVLIRKDVMKQMRAMAKSLAQEGEPQEDLNLLDEDELKETAKKLGDGVSYVKATAIDNENFEGYTAVFAFKDINKLNIDQNPSGSLPSDDSEKKAPPEFITFNLKKGKTAKLTITMPPKKDKKEKASEEEGQEQSPDAAGTKAKDEQQEQMMEAMMQEMMKDMKVSISVEMNGKIKKSNATFKKGNRITLMDIDFNKLLASEEGFKKFVKENPDSMSEAEEIMKSIPGIKMELNQVVNVEFK